MSKRFSHLRNRGVIGVGIFKIRQASEIMMLIELLVKHIPIAEKLMEIKGVGIKTVSGFLVESGI